MQLAISIIGLLGLIGLGFLFSENRRLVKWRIVIVAALIQFAIALLVIKTPFGAAALEGMSNGVQHLMNYANEGIMFLFGGLFTGETKYVFAINTLPIVIFFSALISLLYYFGVMQFIVRTIGGAISKLLGTTKAETFSGVMNIFTGQTDSPLVIKPYLNKLTKSEMFAVLVGGTGSMSGAILVGYAMLGVPLKWLVLACFMTTCSSLLVAKLLVPETEESETNGKLTIDRKQGAVNVFDAISQGVMNGLQMVLAIGAMLIAFISLVALINGLLGLFGISLAEILGYVFYPIAWLTGVDTGEVMRLAQLLGQKFTLNEFIAYSELGNHVGELSERTVAIATIACGGFANLSSIGILLGGFGVLVPEKRHIIAKYGFRAVCGGLLANLISAAIVGLVMLF
ncbi:NupC/NupG family nucleoside CNT transporter [Bacillus thuringiensis]|uniref:NupC/NupG family nucleoside CNT transporter n=1 Tax=Bacillus thuringiensis TaxID=1428 RepID=UPI000BF7186C|nr:nucleoside transporter C-terminal domain-containing protein [Bacillus thuringiensis]PFO26218.1 NupC/NupG family nucleoside CNT transporter [Bacillus thuringiensis]